MSDLEVTHLAVIQNFGLVTDDAVRSKAFDNEYDAVSWVRAFVEQSHGDIALAIPSIVPFRYDLGGIPTTTKTEIWHILTKAGPTNGYVIAVGSDFSED